MVRGGVLAPSALGTTAAMDLRQSARAGHTLGLLLMGRQLLSHANPASPKGMSQLTRLSF